MGRLAERLGRPADDPPGFLADLLDRLGRSPSPLVIPWLEDFWLEEVRVNLPGTPTSQRANWQRPMRPLLEELFDLGDLFHMLLQSLTVLLELPKVRRGTERAKLRFHALEIRLQLLLPAPRMALARSLFLLGVRARLGEGFIEFFDLLEAIGIHAAH